MAPIFLTDGSDKFIRQRLFSYWKALIWGVVAKCKICVQFCVQFPDLTYVNISDLMHTICTIAFSRHFLCFWEVVGFYFGFSCRRGALASVATTAGLSAQRSILFASSESFCTYRNSGLFISNEDRLHSQCIVSKLTCARWHYPCKNREGKDAKKGFQINRKAYFQTNLR